MDNLAAGLALIMIAALANGAFPLPLRQRARYEVENTMAVAMGVATIVIPMIAIYLVFPDWVAALSHAGAARVVAVTALGLAWGLGSVTFGFGIASLGVSLGIAIIMGVVTAIGSTIPLLRRWEAISDTAKPLILAGIALCIVGVALCGQAGMRRERRQSETPGNPGQRHFWLGLSLCIASGVLSACQNIAFDLSEPIGREAARLGISPLFATLPRWLPIFWGGYIAIFAFMVGKMVKDGTYTRYRGPGATRDFALAWLMGFLHFVIVIAYGMATVYLGSRFGTSVGFAIFLASSIIIANALGFLTGEWKNASSSATGRLYAGLAVLIVAIVILAVGTNLS